MDLKSISSRIIFSDNIIRQSLNKQPIVSVTLDDDDQFFQKIKSDIDRNLSHTKENYKPNNYYQGTSLKRKKCIFDEETQNIIKRFKKERNHKIHTLQTSRDINIPQSNHVDNNMKQIHDIITNINTNKNIIQETNMFSSNVLTTNLRNPKNYVFQMASKLQKNVLPFPTVETTILKEEYEESLFFAMFLTPPDNNSIEDNEGFETCSTI
nr:uncharacterized protein LOC117611752 [Osmia lignaria]